MIKPRRFLISSLNDQVIRGQVVPSLPISKRDLGIVEFELEQGHSLLFTVQKGNYLYVYFNYPDKSEITQR